MTVQETSSWGCVKQRESNGKAHLWTSSLQVRHSVDSHKYGKAQIGTDFIGKAWSPVVAFLRIGTPDGTAWGMDARSIDFPLKLIWKLKWSPVHYRKLHSGELDKHLHIH